jgi:predicted RNA-binding Zn ribbon-like protein
MQPLKLDAGNYGGTYKLIGEEICFDFVNTISWPETEREHDWLHSAENFIKWASSTGIINKRQALKMQSQSNAALNQQMKEVFSIRKELYLILTAFAFEKKTDASVIRKLDILFHKIVKTRHIDTGNCEWVWDEPATLPEVLNPVIWNAVYVITELDHSRIKHCDTCNWLFYDKTKNKSRRWCDMDDCGSRDKALRYYHRKKK